VFLVLASAAASVIASDDPAYWIAVMREGSLGQRKAAREALIALGAEAVPALIDMCGDDPDKLLRWEAVNALGAIALVDPASAVPAIPALVERALTDHGGHPRWRSLCSLNNFPDEVIAAEVVPQLYMGLDVPDDQLQWYATVALAYFRQSDAAPLLNHGIEREEWFDRWEAIYCLRFVHNEASVTLLIAVLSDVENTEARLRRESTVTLGKIGDPAALPALIKALSDPDPHIRWRAAQALANVAGESILPELEAALQREDDPFAREQMERIVERLQAGFSLFQGPADWGNICLSVYGQVVWNVPTSVFASDRSGTRPCGLFLELNCVRGRFPLDRDPA